MISWIKPEQMSTLREGERFLTAGKVTSVKRSDGRTLLSLGTQKAIAFKELDVKENDTIRMLGKKGRELPVVEAVKKVPEEYLKLWENKPQLVEDLGEVE